MRTHWIAFAGLLLSIGASAPALAGTPQVLVPIVAAVPAQPGWQPGPGWDRDIEVRCASRDYRYAMCQVDTGQGSSVQLVRQISNTRCVEGQTWGWNRAGVWVNGGCEGVFRVSRRWTGGSGHGHGGWKPGSDWDRDIRVRCASRDYRYQLCQVDTGRGGDVRIERQHSNTRCIEGRNWGWNRAGVWVNGGCDATFVVKRRWR